MGQQHADLTLSENHAVVSRVFADITARDADTDFSGTSTNINKMVRVDDADGGGTIGYFFLTSITPTWEGTGSSLVDEFLELSDTPSTYSGQGGLTVQVNAGETALEFTQALDEWTELSDTPSSITANLVVQGNALGDALEFGQDLTTAGIPTLAGLGIVTSSPAQLLQVGDISTLSVGIIRYAHKSAGNFRSWDLGTGDDTNFGSFDNFGFFDVQAATTYGVIERGSGFWGFGTTDPEARLHAQYNGGQQLTLGFDAVNLARFTVDSGGALTIAPTKPEINLSGDLNVSLDLSVTGAFIDSLSLPGTSGQILSSTVTGTDWIDNNIGDVLISGTPVDNQIAVWTGPTTIEGDADLTFDGATFAIANTANLTLTATSTGTASFADVRAVNDTSQMLLMQIAGSAQTGTFAGITNVNITKLISNADNFAIGTFDQDSPIIFVTNTIERARLTSTGLGIGVTATAKLHVLETTEQLRLAFDATEIASFTVASDGSLLIQPTGGTALGAPRITTLGQWHSDMPGNGRDAGFFSKSSNPSFALEETDSNSVWDIRAEAARMRIGSMNPASNLFDPFIDVTRDGILIDMVTFPNGVTAFGFFQTTAITSLVEMRSDSLDQLRLAYDDSNYAQFVVSSAGDLTITPTGGDVIIAANLTVSGTTTTIDSTTLLVEDKNIELANVTTPTDVTADGGGITVLGATDKTWNWVNATDAWTANQNINLLTGFDYEINAISVLSATTLGSSVLNSSLTSLGTLTSLSVTGTFSDTTGDVGTSGQILSSIGTGTNWIDAASGDVLVSGTPADNELAVWTGANTIEGDSNFTWSGVQLRFLATSSTLRFDGAAADPVVLPNKIILNDAGFGFGVSGNDLDIQSQQNFRFSNSLSGVVEVFTILQGGNVGINESAPSTMFHVASSDGDSTAITTTENTGTNAGITTTFVGSRDPNGNVTGAGGDVYIRDSGATSREYLNLAITTDTEWFAQSVKPSSYIEINTSAQFEELATAGVITITATTTIVILANIVTSSRFSINTGVTLVVTGTLGDEPFSLTYTGTGNFFSGAGTVSVRRMNMVSGSTGTFAVMTGGTFGISDSTIVNWDDLGSVTGGTFLIIRFVTFVSITTGFSITNMTGVVVFSVAHFGVAMTTPFFTYSNRLPDTIFTLSASFFAMSSTGSLLDIDTNNNDLAAVTVTDSSGSTGSAIFKQTTVSEVAITSVTDSSIANGTITAMADNGDSGTTISTTTTYLSGEFVTQSGTTSYNGGFRVFNPVPGVSYDIQTAFVADDATGTIASERLALTVASGHGITAGDSIKVKDTNFYNGFETVLGTGTTTITVNGDFISTNTGNIERDVSLDQTDPRIRGNFNPGFADSHKIACANVNNNTTANGTIVNTVFTDMVFGLAASALVVSSTTQRWKLVNELNGKFEYIGAEPFDGSISFDFTVESSGGTVDFKFKWMQSTSTSISASTIAFVNSNPDTITDSGSGFLTAGFAANDVIDVSGSGSNDGAYTIASVTAGTITLIGTDSLTVESAGAAVTITKFIDLDDNVESLVAVGSDAQSVTKTFPLAVDTGDMIKPQITRNSGSSGITTIYATIFATD